MTKETLPTEPMSSETDFAVTPYDDPGLPTGPLTSSGSGLNTTSIENIFDRIRQTGLVRSQDRWVGGVASGVAGRMGWDPTLVRGLLFASTFLTGLGLVLYGLGWALLPEESDGRIHLQEAIRGRFDSALVGAGLMFLAGVGRNSGGLGSALGHGFAVVSGIVTTALLVVGTVFVIRLVKERRLAGASTFPFGTDAGQVPMTTTSPRVSDEITADAPVTDTFAAAPKTAAADDAAPDVAAHDVVTPEVVAPEVVAQDVVPDPDLEASITNAQVKASKHELHRQERAEAQQEREAWRYARAVEKAKTPVVKGPGAATVGGTLGVIFLLSALAMAMTQTNLPAPAPLRSPAVFVGAVLAVLGSAVIISGFRGRRGGFLNLLAIAALMAAPVASFAGAQLDPNNALFVSVDEAGSPDFGNAMRVVDGDIVVADRARAERGFQAGFGDPVLDLTELALSDDDPITVPISLRAGDLTIIVPDDASVAANIRLLAGEINWEVDGQPKTLSQVGRGRAEMQSEEVSDDSPELSLWIDAGFGNVTIRESQR